LPSILAYIAKTQSVGVGLALMISFSVGLGTLLLIVAVFAGAIRVLPRSGQWLRMIKVISGLILLGFAEYLIFKAGTLGGLS
ncbi:cytochrome c biogenesis protein CcdA, partial [Bdellovibrionota bacterium FG-2]